MNERIKELADQAKQYARERMAHPMNPMLFSAEVFQEKFAELIVRECVKLIRDKDYSHTSDPIFEASCDIEEHFVVEEQPVSDVDRILQTVRTRGMK